MTEPIKITDITYNPPGSDVQGEQVVIRNEGGSALELTNWTLRDVANHHYRFPSFRLQPGAEVRVWTKAGADDAHNLYWGRSGAVWNNRGGEIATLLDERGAVIGRYRYGLTALQHIVVPAFFPPPQFGVLPDWTPIYSSWPEADIAVLNIDLDGIDPSLNDDVFYPATGWQEYAPKLIHQARTQRPELMVLGYVPTNDALAVFNPDDLSAKVRAMIQPYRTAEHVKKYVDKWYGFCEWSRRQDATKSYTECQIDGIFFDEGPATYLYPKPQDPQTDPNLVPVDVRTFYKSIYDYVQGQTRGRGTRVMLNASEIMDEWVMGRQGPTSPVADLVLLFEGTAEKYEHGYIVQPWAGNYQPERIAHVIHTCRREQMCRVLELSKQPQYGAGYVYAYDGTSNKGDAGFPVNKRGYRSLPDYWKDEVKAVREGCQPPSGAKGVGVAPLSDGALELWVADENGKLWTTWKVSPDPGANWSSPWTDFLTEVGQLPAGARDIAVAPLSDGALEFWVTDERGGLWTTWKVDPSPGANWSSPWTDFLAEVGGLPAQVDDIAVAPLPDGALEFWAADTNGKLWTTWKVDPSPGANWSSPWTDFLAEVGGLPSGVNRVAVAPLSDGRLELWVTDMNGSLWTTWKVDPSPGANWAPWSDFLAEVGSLPAGVKQIAVAPLSDGGLELWAVDANGKLWTTWKVDPSPNANWAPWTDFLAEVGSLPG